MDKNKEKHGVSPLLLLGTAFGSLIFYSQLFPTFESIFNYVQIAVNHKSQKVSLETLKLQEQAREIQLRIERMGGEPEISTINAIGFQAGDETYEQED